MALINIKNRTPNDATELMSNFNFVESATSIFVSDNP